MAHQPIDLLRASAELGQMRLGETSLDDVFVRVVDLSRRALPGADEASITRVLRERPSTPAASSDLARRLDEAQFGGLGGPGLEAAGGTTAVAVADTATDRRWPGWAATAAAAGIGSALSVGLPIRDDAGGSLTLYSRVAGAFGTEAVGLARTFAGYAAVALANAHLFDATFTRAEQLREAMRHRAVIEQAKGIVMSERRCTADEAFAVLTKISQDTNRKLRDIAAALVARTTAGPPAAGRGTR